MRSGSRDLTFLLPGACEQTYRLVCMLNAARRQQLNVAISHVYNVSAPRAIRNLIIQASSRFHSWKIWLLEDSAAALNTVAHASFSRHRTGSANPQTLNSSHSQETA